MVRETFLVENYQIAFQELCAGALLILLALVDEMHGQFYPVCSQIDSIWFSNLLNLIESLQEETGMKGSRDL